MIAMSFIFIAPQLWLKGIGLALAVGLLARSVLILRQPPVPAADEDEPEYDAARV